MNLSDDNASFVTHYSPSTHTDVLSHTADKAGDDDVEQADMTWCAAGLESL